MKNSYKANKIPLLGFLAFLLIMIFLTIIFNWFWSGLGADPTNHVRLPFTTNENEFKDYATLYIALLSFGASLFAGLVVFLVFTDWKDQHNTEIENGYIQKILEELRKLTEIHEHLGEIFEDFYNDNKDILEVSETNEFEKYPVHIKNISNRFIYNFSFS